MRTARSSILHWTPHYRANLASRTTTWTGSLETPSWLTALPGRSWRCRPQSTDFASSTLPTLAATSSPWSRRTALLSSRSVATGVARRADAPPHDPHRASGALRRGRRFLEVRCRHGGHAEEPHGPGQDRKRDALPCRPQRERR